MCSSDLDRLNYIFIYASKIKNMYYTITQVRNAFWESNPQFKEYRRTRKRQNDYNTDIRCAFCDWLDSIHKDGLISDRLADKATL